MRRWNAQPGIWLAALACSLMACSTGCKPEPSPQTTQSTTAPTTTPAARMPVARLPFNPTEVPPAPQGENSFRLVVLSDLNGPYGSTQYSKNVHDSIRLITRKLKPELAISAGDMIAGQKIDLTDENLRQMWAGFDSAVVGPLREAGIPFAPTPGNHDGSGYPHYKRERELYRSHWLESTRTPAVQFVERSHYPQYYSFTHKNVLFISLDVTTIAAMEQEQFEWLESQLAGSSGYALRVVTAHVPPYPITQGRETEIMPAVDRERILDLMRRHRVDVFFTGHHHGYFKGRKDDLNLVSLNCCGDGPRKLLGESIPQRHSFVVVDVQEGRIGSCFAIHADSSVFDDATLPQALKHEGLILPRFDY